MYVHTVVSDTLSHGGHINLQDTAGQERYHALGPIYYRDSQGAIVVYDITDEDSFAKVGLYWYVWGLVHFGSFHTSCIQAKNWIKELRKIVGEDIVVCVVGNKIDLEKNRTVSKAEAER